MHHTEKGRNCLKGEDFMEKKIYIGNDTAGYYLKSKCIECENDGCWVYELTEDQFQMIQSLSNIEFVFISSEDYIACKNQRKRLFSEL